MKKTIKKAIRRTREILIHQVKEKDYYMFFYISFWHSLLHNAKKTEINYFCAQPNQGAGIGHQLSNWIAGYYYAQYFGLKFAHIEFSRGHFEQNSSEWEKFLNLGIGEERYLGLLNKGYKKVRLPYFFETKKDFQKISKIIESYSDQKVVFLCEQDQFFRDLYLVSDVLKKKFYLSPILKGPYLYEKNTVSVAVHIRRGDINTNPKANNYNLRWLNDDYYLSVIKKTISLIHTNKKVNIFIFSEGRKEDFEVYKMFDNVKLCLDVNAQDSFEHMALADVLITSKSSFSYKPALLNNGYKVCPKNFWHGYPDEDHWLLVDDYGKFINESCIDL